MSRQTSLRRRTEGALFSSILRFVAGLARSPLRAVVAPFLGATARGVRLYRGSRANRLEGEALGREWTRLFPDPKTMVITQVEGDTAFGEIRIRCPLRGTGDVHACHRMMAYDRALMAPHGARFVVLRSQAEPGVRHCKVAMRPADRDAGDLEEAHVRVERLRQASGRPRR